MHLRNNRSISRFSPYAVDALEDAVKDCAIGVWGRVERRPAPLPVDEEVTNHVPRLELDGADIREDVARGEHFCHNSPMLSPGTKAS